jgi:DNA-binding transcriptional MerR regulator
MRYSLPELVLASGVPVDTVRYYQTLGLLDPPRHEGRNAVYEAAHLDRLRLIRSMSKRGLSLKVIGLLLKRGGAALESDQALLTAIEEEAAEPSYSRAELAAAIGVPQALLLSVEKAGLAEAQEQEDGSTRYTESDLKAARGALKLLGYGFPLTRMLTLAAQHHRAIRRSVDEAIELFDAHVRKRGGGHQDPDGVARAFKEILPLVTALVAHHFQRLLMVRALKRLKKTGDRDALRAAVEASARTRVGLTW